jgi:hypothetical protein
MKHVFIPREGDKERFADYENHFRELSDRELLKPIKSRSGVV